MRPRKFRNVKEGGYDSKAEARMGASLELAKHARDPALKVVELERQVRYELLPAQRDVHGTLLERAVHFIADFRVRFADGREEVIDVKSPVTRRLPAYVLKRKLLLMRHGLRVREVE